MRKKVIRHKIWIVVAIVFGLFIGILVIPSIKDNYFKSNTVVEPSGAPEISLSTPPSTELLDQKNWIEYKDQEFNISFKYPKDFVINIFNEPNQEITYFNGITFGRMKAPHGTVYNDTFQKLGYEIDVKVDRTTKLNELLPEMDRYNDRPEFKKSTFKIGTIQAYRYEGVGLDWFRTVVLFERNNKLYSFILISFTKDDPLFEEGKKIFDLMIKSIEL